MTTGTIKKVIADRGFGFISAEDEKEYFFHRGGLDSSLDFDRLVGGEKVEFEIEASPKGPRAAQVQLRLGPTARRQAGRFGSLRSPGPSSVSRLAALRLGRASAARAHPRAARADRPRGPLPSFESHSSPPIRRAAAGSPPSPMTWPASPAVVKSSPCTRPSQATPYPIEVHHRIRRDEARRLPRRPLARSTRCVDVVSIQHEYGIWGGQDGDHVIDFVRALRVPAVATLHTVLRDPTPGQRAVLSELVASTAATVVMSKSAATLLTNVYDVDPGRVESSRTACPTCRSSTPSTSSPASASRAAT